jgi:hypothetical protein
MFASMEKKIIGKNYDEHIEYHNPNSIWCYKYKKQPINQISLDYDNDIEKYIFSFPMKTGDINYTTSFDNYSDTIKYMDFIVNHYL